MDKGIKNQIFLLMFKYKFLSLSSGVKYSYQDLYKGILEIVLQHPMTITKNLYYSDIQMSTPEQPSSHQQSYSLPIVSFKFALLAHFNHYF